MFSLLFRPEIKENVLNFSVCDMFIKKSTFLVACDEKKGWLSLSGVLKHVLYVYFFSH